MSFVGRTVATGPWAGWRIVSARAVLYDVGMLTPTKAGRVEYSGLFKCVCKLEDPTNLKCTGGGVVLFERDLSPPRAPRAQLKEQ